MLTPKNFASFANSSICKGFLASPETNNPNLFRLIPNRVYKIAGILGTTPIILLGFEIPKLEEKSEIEENNNIKKIEDLEKRIKELEDRVEDKNTIIFNLLNKFEIYTDTANDLIIAYVFAKANEFGLITFEKLDKIRKEPFTQKGTMENNETLFKSKGLKWRVYVSPDDMNEIIEKSYNTDSEMLYYIFSIGLTVNSNIEEMKLIKNTYIVHSKDIESQNFNGRINFLVHKHLDKLMKAQEKINDFGIR